MCAMCVIGGCSNDDDMPDPDPGDCDAENVSFSADIMPILQANCFNGCHSGSSPMSGFTLTTYSDVKAKVDEGRLYGAVAREPGFVEMPQDSPPLSDCNVEKIGAWIDEGAMNN